MTSTLNTSNSEAQRRASQLAPGIEGLVRPRTVAIIGMSSKPGSAGQVVLNNLVAAGYSGVHAIRLEGRVAI